MLVSIVIPAYNEASSIEAHLDDIVAYARSREGEHEVLVVDDGSTDRTAELVEARAARDPEVRLLRQDRNRGKGAAVRRGLLEARGDVRGFSDADASTPITELDRVLRAFEAGADVVIGSRARPDTATRVKARLHRRFIGRTFNAILRALVGVTDQDGRVIADTQCGFKWFRGGACDEIFGHSVVDGFAFDVEVLYLANRLGYRIAELPINWSDRGESKVNLLVDPLKMLWSVAKVPWRHRHLRRVPAGGLRGVE